MSRSSSPSSSPPIAMKDVVHKLQLCLLDGITSETQLFVAGSLLSKSDYNDVVIERSIAQMCGYPLCPNSLPSPSPSEPQKKGRYRISLKEHKVYDLLETRMYCSTKCVVDSRSYAESLQEERSLALDTAKVDKVLRLFEGFSLKAEEGLEKNSDFGLRNLSIKEKEGGSVSGEAVSMEEWVGPSNAIEGYVPQHDRSSRDRPGSKLKGLKLKREEESIFDEMNFMSTIITQDDGYSISKEPSGQTKKTSHNKLKDSRKKMNHKGTNDRLAITAESTHNATQLNKSSNAESEIVTGHKTTISDSVADVEVMEICKGPVCDKDSRRSSGSLKSSLKPSGAIRTNCSVTWADEKTNAAHNQILSKSGGNEKEKETGKGFGIMDKSIDDDDRAFRLASAEACALALSQAAEAVAAGESDVPVAVSEAGLLILPHPLDDNKAISKEIVGAVDPEPAQLKWQKGTGIVESDFFDSEDSWFDSPPEEFVVDLSPFATMFMSLFAWISSSTLAYVYGRDDSFHEEYAMINGREYPRKVIATDGRSSEIKQTLAGCLSRALPGLVHDLRLPTPVSTIEYGMGCLLDTMSFLDPLPPLRMKQWQVFVLLLIDALSVCRIPAIAPHLTNKRRFFQKVFDDGRISREEYEVLKDLMLPLGRVPQFAMQSGG